MSVDAAVPRARRSAIGRARLLIVPLLILLVAVAITPIRRGALRGLGSLLIASDPLEPVDIAVQTENVEGGELELSDLYRAHVISKILILVPVATAVDQELARRGVHLEDQKVTILAQLGVPREAITRVDAGEGGTTDSTESLAEWAAVHPVRILVIVNTSHARRFRRALRRQWPEKVPIPVVRYPRTNLFRAEDWWTRRSQRREGLFELQKLAWEYLAHPFS